jgi:hypothetical protein
MGSIKLERGRGKRKPPLPETHQKLAKKKIKQKKEKRAKKLLHLAALPPGDLICATHVSSLISSVQKFSMITLPALHRLAFRPDARNTLAWHRVVWRRCCCCCTVSSHHAATRMPVNHPP